MNDYDYSRKETWSIINWVVALRREPIMFVLCSKIRTWYTIKKRLEMNLYNWLASVFKLMISFISIFSLHASIYVRHAVLKQNEKIILVRLSSSSSSLSCIYFQTTCVALWSSFCLSLGHVNSCILMWKDDFETMQMRICISQGISFIRKDILIRLILIMS